MSRIFRVHEQLKIDAKVVHIATGIIDLGCFFRCIPYRRTSEISSQLGIQINSWYWYVLFTGLVWMQALAQWISFLMYVSQNGVNARAGLHLNFLAIYTFSVFLSLQILLRPESMIQVQNAIQGMQQNFATPWTQHPVTILLVPAFPVMLVAIPVIAAALYVMNPTCPMFVVTSALFTKVKSPMRLHKIGKLARGALLEAFLIFYSALITFTVSQTCAILDVALDMWIHDVR